VKGDNGHIYGYTGACTFIDNKGGKKVVRVAGYKPCRNMPVDKGLGKAQLLPKADVFLYYFCGSALKLLVAFKALHKLSVFQSKRA
jgi:hypothetical protein